MQHENWINYYSQYLNTNEFEYLWKILTDKGFKYEHIDNHIVDLPIPFVPKLLPYFIAQKVIISIYNRLPKQIMLTSIIQSTIARKLKGSPMQKQRRRQNIMNELSPYLPDYPITTNQYENMWPHLAYMKLYSMHNIKPVMKSGPVPLKPSGPVDTNIQSEDTPILPPQNLSS